MSGEYLQLRQEALTLAIGAVWGEVTEAEHLGRVALNAIAPVYEGALTERDQLIDRIGWASENAAKYHLVETNAALNDEVERLGRGFDDAVRRIHLTANKLGFLRELAEQGQPLDPKAVLRILDGPEYLT